MAAEDKKKKSKYGNGSIRYNMTNDCYVITYKGTSRSAKTKKLAEEKLRELKQAAKDVSENELKRQRQNKAKGKQTVVEVIEQYLDTKYKRQHSKIRTIQREQETFELVKRMDIANIAIKDLTADMIWDDFICVLQDCRSHSTSKKAYELLKATLRWASSKKQGIVLYNECDEITFPPAETFKYDLSVADKVKFYSFKQQEAIIQACDATWSNGKPITQYGALIKLLLYTGLREGEVCYLKWQHIDLINRTMTIQGTVIEDSIIDDTTHKKVAIAIPQDSPKTKGSRRTIPLSDEAYKALMTLRATFGDEGFVVKTEDGEMFRPSYVRKKMESIIKRIAKNDPSILNVQSRVHALRHTFATNTILWYMREQGLSKENAIHCTSYLLGHTTLEITNSTYNHMFDVVVRTNETKIA